MDNLLVSQGVPAACCSLSIVCCLLSVVGMILRGASDILKSEPRFVGFKDFHDSFFSILNLLIRPERKKPIKDPIESDIK